MSYDRAVEAAAEALLDNRVSAEEDARIAVEALDEAGLLRSSEARWKMRYDEIRPFLAAREELLRRAERAEAEVDRLTLLLAEAHVDLKEACRD